MVLAKKYRLKNWRNFQAVYKKGRFYRSANLKLKALFESSPINIYRENNTEAKSKFKIELEPTCIGISISKKVSKKAVIRNRIKRLIKASFRELLPLIQPGWKLIIIVDHSAIECQYEHFLRQLKKLFIKAGIINGN